MSLPKLDGQLLASTTFTSGDAPLMSSIKPSPTARNYPSGNLAHNVWFTWDILPNTPPLCPWCLTQRPAPSHHNSTSFLTTGSPLLHPTLTTFQILTLQSGSKCLVNHPSNIYPLMTQIKTHPFTTPSNLMMLPQHNDNQMSSKVRCIHKRRRLICQQCLSLLERPQNHLQLNRISLQ